VIDFVVCVCVSTSGGWRAFARESWDLIVCGCSLHGVLVTPPGWPMGLIREVCCREEYSHIISANVVSVSFYRASAH